MYQFVCVHFAILAEVGKSQYKFLLFVGQKELCATDAPIELRWSCKATLCTLGFSSRLRVTKVKKSLNTLIYANMYQRTWLSGHAIKADVVAYTPVPEG